MPYINSPHDNARLYYADYHPPTTSPAHPETRPFIPTSPLTTHPTPSSLPSDFTLLFLHGWPMSSEMYTPYLLALSQTHNIRCVAPDRRGFGRSEWVGRQGRGDVTYETLAGDVLAVVQDAGIGREGEWAVVAASMGCAESVILEGMLEGEVGEKVSFAFPLLRGEDGEMMLMGCSSRGLCGWGLRCRFR